MYPKIPKMYPKTLQMHPKSPEIHSKHNLKHIQKHLILRRPFSAFMMRKPLKGHLNLWTLT